MSIDAATVRRIREHLAAADQLLSAGNSSRPGATAS